MARWVGAQGQVKLTKCENIPQLRRHPQKIPNPIENFFLIETIRFAESVEGLNTSLGLPPGELWLKYSPKVYRLLQSSKGFKLLIKIFTLSH